MSSCLTAPTSTTASSSNSRSPLLEIVACGALAGHVREIVARRGWPAAVTPLPAVLHNRPRQIVLEAEADRVAGMFSLPLTRVDVGVSRLEQALACLLAAALWPACVSCCPRRG